MYLAIKNEGPLSLYKGLGPLLVGMIPLSTLFFTTTEATKRWITNRDPGMKSWKKSFYAGAFAGMCGLSISVPVDLLKSRAQIVKDGKLNQIAEIKSILKSEGVLGMYRGFWASAIRDIPGCAVYFASFEFFKKLSYSLVPYFSTS
jgi:hypothetical protein